MLSYRQIITCRDLSVYKYLLHNTHTQAVCCSRSSAVLADLFMTDHLRSLSPAISLFPTMCVWLCLYAQVCVCVSMPKKPPAEVKWKCHRSLSQRSKQPRLTFHAFLRLHNEALILVLIIPHLSDSIHTFPHSCVDSKGRFTPHQSQHQHYFSSKSWKCM